jgi:hypothetical protein
MPDFTALVPDETGSLTHPTITQWQNQSNFAMRIMGFIDIPTTGIYGFNLASDDGSLLFIDGVRIINNDGLHARREVTGWAKLEAGLHPIEIHFFERSGDEVMHLTYRPPGSNFPSELIPNSMWRRNG